VERSASLARDESEVVVEEEVVASGDAEDWIIRSPAVEDRTVDASTWMVLRRLATKYV
jgi:hypothetical protein